MGQSGKDGVKSVSSSGIIVNDYTTLTSNASAGASVIQVASNVLNNNFGAQLGAGDLIFIIQMQGASIVTIDDPTYGNITSYNNCGHNEFAEVASVTGNSTIGLSCPLQNDYSVSGVVQVLRVPRYSMLTISTGGGITCPAWNGSTGGVVAIEVSGASTVNGSIDANGKGFRGGNLFDNNTAYGVLNWRYPTDDYGAEKGESIAGSVTDYDNMGGRYCKGAPANGGGGGSGHNTGGGGGGNAASIAYNGNGTPDVSNATWANAWDLEYAGFSSSASGGGGKGGYSFSSTNQNALTVGPFNSAWGGDQRRDNGGRGGRPLDYSTGRIFMGGGGGAGEQNDSKGGRGGNGGGIVSILSYGGISGNGQISVNGDNGFNALTNSGTDGSGGGGGGGCIILNTSTATSGVSLYAKGGNGGSQSVNIFTVEAEGPGGGGGGGYIGISTGAPARNASGGVNGTTNSNSLAEFPPNGATKGSAGIANGAVSAFRILPQTINICSGTSKQLVVITQGPPVAGTTYQWYDQAVGGTLLSTGTSYTTPVLTANQVYYVSSCPGVTRVPVTVNVNGGMTASYTSTGTCAGTPVTFTGTGSANVITWLWDFDDGTAPSAQQNPVHTFLSGGTYTVTMTVGDGNCTMTVSNTITISNNPVANFTAPAGTNCGALPVQFTNTSTGAAGYSWNFGDGTPASSQQNPSHTFATSGTYTVVLTASNSGCSSTHSTTVTIGNKPLASFSNTSAHCVGDVISFTDISSGNGSPLTSWSWNFGDGSPLSSVQSPSHSYANQGAYTVTLTAHTATCFDDTSLTINITAIPIINFSAQNLTGCAPFTVPFTNTTSGSPQYTWNFGDGTPVSTAANPSHTYSSAGAYDVTLIANENGCADTLTIPNMITVGNSPTASFNSLTGICLGDSLHFTNNSNGNGNPIILYNWDFGDGSAPSSLTNPVHAFPAAGNYNVHLTASNNTCSDDTIVTINVSPGPVASFSAPVTTACGTLNVSFNNTTGGQAVFTWNFGDGTPVSNISSPSHTYSSPGSYTVTLIATQGTCSDTLSQVNYITVANSPLSAFSVGDVCLGDSARFTNNSTGGGQPLTGYSWTFGDGGTSASASPAHYYQNTGSYNVQLTVSNAGCSDDTIMVVNVNPAPAVVFTPNISNACDSATVTFTNNSTNANSFSWLFGDGGTSTALNPVHTYSSPGFYTVTLTASSGQCSVTQARLNAVVIRSTPVVSASASRNNICKGECVTFTSNAQGATSWAWLFSGALTSTSTLQNPAGICYSSSGSYDVTLTASDGFCTGSQTYTSFIHVIDCAVAPTASFISSDTLLCANNCISFVDLSTNAQNWQWSFPGANPASSTDENPAGICYSQPGSYDVQLISSNPSGSDTFTIQAFIQVTNGPLVPVITQNGNTLTSSPASQYQWYRNNIMLSNATGQQFTALLSGDYFVVITDAGGCTASSSVLHVSLVGIEEEYNTLSVKVYPTPATDKLFMQFTSIKSLNLTIRLADISGRIVESIPVYLQNPAQTEVLDIQKLAPGIYFLQIISTGGKWTFPVLHE